MATIGTVLYTALHGRHVGTDAYGNKYYEARSDKASSGLKKRWVIYKGLAEPSKVPPTWHGWLHYTSNERPSGTGEAQPHAWGKEAQPNLTGTTLAYVPQGHVTRGGERAKTVADYEAWKP